jgi:hypothetical protein
MNKIYIEKRCKEIKDYYTKYLKDIGGDEIDFYILFQSIDSVEKLAIKKDMKLSEFLVACRSILKTFAEIQSRIYSIQDGTYAYPN